MDSAPDFPSNHVVPVWFNVVPTMPKRWHVLVSRRPNDEKQCGSHVVPRGSNNDDMDSGPDFPSNHVVPVWFSVAPTNADVRVLQPSNKTFLAGCGPLLDVSSALTKGGQVMFCPQPLLELPCKAERWQRAHKRKTSNVSPSTITSAP